MPLNSKGEDKSYTIDAPDGITTFSPAPGIFPLGQVAELLHSFTVGADQGHWECVRERRSWRISMIQNNPVFFIRIKY